jgi:tetratricopeptide (TPR) repeat protein
MLPTTSAALAIEHVDKSTPAAFTLKRLPDGKSAAAVEIASPYEFPVEGQPNSNLMQELRWYLEKFLDYPFHPETDHAEHVLDALKGWGTQAFNALFDRRDVGNWLAGAGILQVRSDDPHILSWPWEALFDPRANYLAHERRIERRLNQLADPPALGALPNDRVNILLVVARPYEDDVRYRSIARPLIELIQSKGLPAHVDVLRPPTFDQLRDQLRAKPGYYHVVHFDGHGAYGGGGGHYSAHQFQGRQGCLVFENEKGEADPKSAGDLSALLHEYAVPAVVLNACQSGMLGADAEGPFASVATALLQSGMRSVVAMAYSLYVSGAQEFLPAFYRRLFEKGSVAEAVRAGRQEMLAHKGRICARGRYPLEDWLLPVLYQQEPVDFGFVRQAKVEERKSRLPEEVRERRDEYGFVGRDGPILEMERALHRKAPAILVQGLGGIGKTTLARGFLRWLDDTGGLDGALWFDFRDIRTAEYVINRTGEAFYGENFGVAPNKLELLGRALSKTRVLMVWDNFEPAASNLKGEDRAELGRLLDAIRGGRGKVIITSRSREEWLKPPQRFELTLRGLDGEERWEYCEVILQELGLKVDRNDPELSGLMKQLGGHPLAMRVVLPKLEEMPAAKIAEALRTNIKELGLNEEEEQGRLFATLRFVEQGLAEELRPLLGLAGLHEGYMSVYLLELMATQVDAGWTRERIDRFVAALASAGLVRDIGQATYEMHPLLTSYLRSRVDGGSEQCRRAFVDVMGSLADTLAPLKLHEQRVPFLLHGANLHFALVLAERLSMDQGFAALTQSLASFAENSRNFGEAFRLFESVARHWSERGESRGESSAYHQLGRTAEEQRDFEKARHWYLRSLTISEESGYVDQAAATYHQLGRVAQEQQDFEQARGWCLKSLAIEEKLGNVDGAAISYHQLGVIAQMQQDFEKAREWYLKSLAIEEKLGNQSGTAMTYHQLGTIAQQLREFEAAREWYLKSLAMSEKMGIEHYAAATYNQLGIIAQQQSDFERAREWYLKSLAIKEKQGNLHGAASTYGQLGLIAGSQGSFEDAGRWLTRCIGAFLQTHDQHAADRNIRNFLLFHKRASPDTKHKLEAIWREAGLGGFPTEPNS